MFNERFCCIQGTFNLVVTAEMLRNRGGGQAALHNINSIANVQLRATRIGIMN